MALKQECLWVSCLLWIRLLFLKSLEGLDNEHQTMMLTDGLKGGMVTHSTDVKGRPFLGSGLCGDHSHGLQ